MSTTDHTPLLQLALRLAREAGQIALPRARQHPLARKADDSMVTQTDHDVQAHIVQQISGEFPEHAILAEETDTRETFCRPGDVPHCWVIDPIDGTRNFITGFPAFATSIAVLENGKPVVGVIREHNQGAEYAAMLGHGAKLDGLPMHVRQPPPREDWLIGGPSTKEPLTTHMLEKIIHAPDLLYRNVGSSAVHLAWVASGAMAGAFAKRCKLWDVAAGVLLITEAGGTITDVFGASLSPFRFDRDPDHDLPFVAGPSAVHARLLALIREAM